MGTVNSGPIPGANMTADTKNLPWHQPPKFTDIDEAMDFITDKLTQFKVANGFLTMSEIGIPLVKQTQIFLMQGVSGGFWNMDFALLLAGPVTRLIELLHIGFHIPYVVGYEEDPSDFQTGSFFKGAQQLKSSGTAGFKVLKDGSEDVKAAADDLPTDGQGAPADHGSTSTPANTGQASPDLMQQGFMAMTSQPQGQPPAKPEGK